MKKLLLFLLLFVVSACAFAQNAHTLSSHLWGGYRLVDGVHVDANTFHTYTSITMNTDYVYIESGDNKLLFNVESFETSTDDFKGLYLYCDKKVLVNLYKGYDGHWRIVILQNGYYLWYYLD